MHLRTLHSSLVAMLSIIQVASAAAASGEIAAVARLAVPGQDAALADAVAAEVKAAGYGIVELDVPALCDASRLAALKPDLLVLPNGSELPSKAAESIERYLRGGGDLIALNAPLWRRPLIQVNGEWLTHDDHQRRHAGTLPENVLFDFRQEELARWQRSSNHMEEATRYEAKGAGPVPGRWALHAVVPDLNGWDTYLSPSLTAPFPAEHVLTVVSAKGGPDTNRLAIEWTEKDGSRWFVAIPLTSEWRQYVLAPQQFVYWQSNPARGRGGDRFKPENAVRLSVGVAYSHTGHVRGRKEYWVGPIGTAAMTPEYQEVVEAFAPPALDTLSPTYKLFDCHDVKALQTSPDQVLTGAAEFALPTEVRSPQPRASGAGFDKGRAWRWMPLIEARTAGGEWRGTPATLLVHADGPFAGGVWASFGIGGPDWYKSPAAIRTIGQIARRMRHGVFILDGGTNYYTNFEEQEVRLGLRVANVSDERRTDLTARVTLTDSGTGREAVRRQWPVTISPHESVTVADTWKPERWPDGGYRVVAEILENGKPIDRVSHDVFVWRPKSRKSFITIEGGNFMLDGRRWRAHGVNYMPSSGIGTEDGEYFERWLGARSYDPDVIERDLRHIKDLGLNAVSIFIDRVSMPSQNLLDLLRRLEALGMKANVSLRPSWPLNFKFEPIREIIEHYRLSEHDAIFALDLAWEPMFGMHEDRVPFDADWEAWIIERYGSIESAEKDWAFRAPRTPAGKVTNPLAHQIDTDGEWRRMTAAYRRFLDTLLYTKYSAARALVRGVDPNHHVSFRMAEAGNPTFRWDGRIPYDFPYLSGAVDFLAPEAYGRIGDWEQVKPGWFEFEYGRWASGHKPLLWAEMGVSTWDLGRMASPPEAQESQARFFRAFYRMLAGTGANGIFYWWYPGGFRCGERSDFGIINPDGSDRPVSRVIREHARAFLDGPDSHPIDRWIEIDRDRHPDGIAGIYDTAKEEFWQAIDTGHTPGFRTAGTGTTSANCPLLAVGNTPCNGTNPPKYLDAAFDRIEVEGAGGRWQPIDPGGRVQVSGNRPVVARVTLTNLGEAEWLATDAVPSGTKPSGAVYIVAQHKDTARTAIPASVLHLGSVQVGNVALAPAGLKEQTTVTITLTAEGRTPFGPKVRLTFIPQ